jgi:hypothetical protein
MLAILAPIFLALGSGSETPAPDWVPISYWDPPNELERRIVDRALRCVRMKVPADPIFLLDMLRFEERAGVPPSLRGMLLAAACSESGFDPGAEGDDRKGKAMAVGLLQMWPWWERHYGIDRRDAIQAAETWLVQVYDQLKKTRRRCGRRLRGEKLWVTAWVRSVRAPRKDGRCHQVPKHFERFNRWRKNWWRLVWSSRR